MLIVISLIVGDGSDPEIKTGLAKLAQTCCLRAWVTVTIEDRIHDWRILMRTRHGALARLTLLAVGIVISLSGCLNVDVKLTLDSKALASGSYTMEVTKEVAALAGITSAQGLEDALNSSQDSPLPEGSFVDTKETDTGYEMTVNMVDAPMTDSDMGAEVLPDGRIKFSFKQDGSADSSGSDLGLGVGSMKLEITFPGNVVESSPEFSKAGNNVVSLSTTLDQTLDVYAISEAGGSGSNSSFPVVPVVIAVVLLLAIGYGIMRDRAAAAKSTQVEPTDPVDQVN